MKPGPARVCRWCVAAAALCAASATIILPGRGQQSAGAAETNPLAALRFRFVGPVGNRAAAVVGEPGNPAVAYVGAASGGIWKTDDGGVNWRPIFDHTDVAAIGALAIAPSEHNIVWAGTGEPWVIRPDYPMGDGVYKSTDAGRSWQHMGLEQTGRVARIVIDPHDANRLFVCAPGQLYKPAQQQGIFRTLDGGKTWQQVLFVNDQTGCSEMAMSPNDPNTLFAGMWQAQIRTWNLMSGGTGSGVYASRDGGSTWTKLSGHGLPAADHPLGKVAVAFAPSDPNRVYALLQDTTPGLYRSMDGGRTWTLVNQQHQMTERSSYYTRFAVSPDNENLLYFVSVAYSLSVDGGQTIFQPGMHFENGRPQPDASGQASGGGDNHDVWIDPTNANRIMVANDGGATISLNHGRSFQRVVLPIAQIYHVYADDEIPYHVMGNRQDGDSYRGPSRTLTGGFFGGGGITAGEWTATGGCESGFAVPDPADSNIVWSGCYDGMLTRMDFRTGQARDVTVWPDAAYGWAPADVKYRWHWTFPIAISPHDHNRVYVGSQVVHVTTDGGQSWQVISPDLTLNDKSHQQPSGGVSHDNLMTFDGATLYSIAESPVKASVIWTGSNDGQVNVTQDGGAHWTNVTKNIPDLPAWGTVWNIEPSHFEAGAAYITVNFEQVGNYDAYVYKTADFGRSWKFISGSIPKSMNSSAHSVIEDPVRQGMLYLGTDNAIYVSWDDGGSWTHLRNNFPPAPVYWLALQPRFNDLVVATYGRGIWILDDVTPLRDYDRAQQQDVYLFKPRSAYRFRRVDAIRSNDEGSHVIGQNPPAGADLDFWLKSPEKNIEISILGAKNQVIRTIKTDGHAGLNRVWWNLRYESAAAARLRTPPPDAAWVKNGPEGWRPIVAWSTTDPMLGPIAAPGSYTVRLKAGQKELTAPLDVLPDPHSLGNADTIRAQVAFLLEVRGELNDAAGTINHIEWTRKQLADLAVMLGEQGTKYAAVIQAAKDLDAKAAAAEGKLVDIHLTGAREDSFRNPMRLYGKLATLYGGVDGDSGSGGGGADLGPTAQETAVNAELKQQLAAASSEFKQLTDSATPAFNSLLKQNHLTAAIEP
ncbi:MAG TPA: hypothetical protein VGS20_00075 [Candidatus Acidoferrales bacterium]|nr:hypothetical protein [Candidatus Acidoferrales bacterium]